MSLNNQHIENMAVKLLALIYPILILAIIASIFIFSFFSGARLELLLVTLIAFIIPLCVALHRLKQILIDGAGDLRGAAFYALASPFYGAAAWGVLSALHWLIK